MSGKLSTAVLSAFGLLFCCAAQADWQTDLGNLWDEAKEVGNEWTEKGKSRLEEAQNKIAEEWNKLGINHKLKAAFGYDVDERSALVGRFYDLKQPLNENAKSLSSQEVVEKIRELDNRAWDQSILANYYSPKVRLYAPYFYLPRCKASYAPKAFQCDEDDKRSVNPCRWVVVYRGVVTAPESGFFRFAGMGDDVLMVRFNNKLVLESGWSIPTRGHLTLGTHSSYWEEMASPKYKRAFYRYENTPHWNYRIGGIPTGNTFRVQKGGKYPIEILISEIPGNEFGFCLLIEKIKSPQSAPYGIFPQEKSPVLDLFRTNESLPDFKAIECALTDNDEDYRVGDTMEGPPFKAESPVWQADYAAAKAKGFFDNIFELFREDNTAMGKRKYEEN